MGIGTRRQLDALAKVGLASEGYYGLVKEFDDLKGSITEASRVGMVLNVLAMFGNLMGRRAFLRIGPTQQYGTMFIVTVGRSAMSRKGHATAEVSQVFDLVDPDRPIGGSLATGQGIIYRLRDANNEKDPPDPGATEKRLLCIEEEFGGLLTRCSQGGSILSHTVRKAWDGGKLSNMTMVNPLTATGHSVSIIGHIVQEELLAKLSHIDQADGFANRFNFGWVTRAGVFAVPPQPSHAKLQSLVGHIRGALDWIKALPQKENEFTFDAPAQIEYEMAYTRLTRERSSLIGMLTARRATQVCRMALIYAAMDRSQFIRLEHLHAAMAVWNYVERSTELIFDDKTGNPLADVIRGWLRKAGATGMTRTEILRQNGNRSEGLNDALDLLETEEIAYREKQESKSGPKAERWFIHGDPFVAQEPDKKPILTSTGILTPKSATSATSGKP